MAPLTFQADRRPISLWSDLVVMTQNLEKILLSPWRPGRALDAGLPRLNRVAGRLGAFCAAQFRCLVATSSGEADARGLERAGTAALEVPVTSQDARQLHNVVTARSRIEQAPRCRARPALPPRDERLTRFDTHERVLSQIALPQPAARRQTPTRTWR